MNVKYFVVGGYKKTKSLLHKTDLKYNIITITNLLKQSPRC